MAMILEISQVITESDVDEPICENNVSSDDDENLNLLFRRIDIEL